MATVYASIGTRSNISIADGDSKLPSSASGSGTFASPYSLTYNSSPGDVGVGDKLAVSDDQTYMGTFYYYVKSVSSNTVEVVFMYEDSGMYGNQDPTSLETMDYMDYSLKTSGHTYSRTYSTVASWESGLNNSNFYSSNDDLVGWIHDDSDFTEENVIFNYTGTTYDSIKLTVNEADRHDGVEGAGAVNKPNANPGSETKSIYNLSIDNFTIEWIEIDMSSSTSTSICVQTGTSNTQSKINATIQHLLIHSWGTNQTPDPMHGILLRGGSGGYHHVFNCICYDFQESDDHVTAFNMNQSRATVKCYNNTSYDMLVTTRTDKYATGFLWGTNGTINIKNCIAIDSVGQTSGTSTDFRRSGGSDDCDFCLSSDSTASTYGTNAQTSKTAANTFESGYPTSGLFIKSDSDAAGNGTDLGTEANIDIKEFDRNSVTVDWDIGAHQVTTSPAATPVSFDRVVSVESLLSFSDNRQALIEHLLSLSENKQAVVEYLLSISENRQAVIEYSLSFSDTRQIVLEHLLSFSSDVSPLVEYISSISTDKSAAIEYLLSISDDKQAAIEYLLSFSEDKQTAIEHLLSLSEDKQAALEHLLSFSEDQQAAIEHLLSFSEDKQSLIEHVGSLSTDKQVLIETLLNLSIDKSLLTEYILSFSSDFSVPISNIATLSSDKAIILETLLLLSEDRQAQIEFLASLPDVSSSKQFLIEYLTSIQEDRATNIENLQNLSLDKQASVEHIISIPSVTKQVSIENLLGLSEDRATNIESLLDLSTDRSFPAESLLSVSGDFTFPSEHLLYLSEDKVVVLSFKGSASSISADKEITIEYLSAITSNNVIPLSNISSLSLDREALIESIGSLSTDKSIPVEGLLSISSDSTAQIEHLISFSSDNSILLETISSISQDLSIPLSWSLEIASDGVFYIDWTKNIDSSDHQLVIETLKGHEFTKDLNLSYISSIEVDSVVPLSWQGVFTQKKALAWILGMRGSLWSLSSRGDLNWILSNRKTEWKLPEKSGGWSIQNRTNEWVL